jgi:hypothetical protein
MGPGMMGPGMMGPGMMGPGMMGPGMMGPGMMGPPERIIQDNNELKEENKSKRNLFSFFLKIVKKLVVYSI